MQRDYPRHRCRCPRMHAGHPSPVLRLAYETRARRQDRAGPSARWPGHRRGLSVRLRSRLERLHRDRVPVPVQRAVRRPLPSRPISAGSSWARVPRVHQGPLLSDGDRDANPVCTGDLLRPCGCRARGRLPSSGRGLPCPGSQHRADKVLRRDGRTAPWPSSLRSVRSGYVCQRRADRLPRLSAGALVPLWPTLCVRPRLLLGRRCSFARQSQRLPSVPGWCEHPRPSGGRGHGLRVH